MDPMIAALKLIQPSLEALIRAQQEFAAALEALQPAEQLKLAWRLRAVGWPNEQAMTYAWSVPAEVCWLYPTPAYRGEQA